MIQIRELAEQRLVKFEKTLDRRLTFPLRTELFGKIVLDLSVCWEEIEELPCEQILAGLRAERRLIVMNERRRRQMDEDPGRRRLAQAYEIALWDLFVTEAECKPGVPLETPGPDVFAHRNSSGGRVQIVERIVAFDPGCDLLGLAESSNAPFEEGVSASCYAAAILMPWSVITEEAGSLDCKQFRNLHRLAEQFGVTISALRIRLEQLNLINLGDGGRKASTCR